MVPAAAVVAAAVEVLAAAGLRTLPGSCWERPCEG